MFNQMLIDLFPGSCFLTLDIPQYILFCPGHPTMLLKYESNEVL